MLVYEKARKNNVLRSDGAALRDGVRSRSAKMQEERQELPDERREGMQLR